MKDPASYHRADRQFIFSEFVEALVRVAHAKYPELPSLAQRFSVTLYTKVFLHSCPCSSPPVSLSLSLSLSLQLRTS